jgi:hypothetical protein
MINYISVIPFIAIIWFIIFFKNNHLNAFLTGLIFVSYLFFATNYSNFNSNIDVFRYLHRLIGVILILFILAHIVRFKINLFKEQVPILLALFFAALILSFIGNDIYFPYYYHYVRNFIFISAIVLYLYYFIDSNEKLSEILDLIFYLTLIVTFFTIVETSILGYSSRVDLYFGNPNYLGISLIPGFTVALFSSNKLIKTLSLLILIAIFCTGSRAAELSAIFSLLAYLYYKDFNKIYLVPLLIAIVSLSFIFFDKIVINKDKSISRLAFAAITYNIFQQHPLNGIGYGQFRRNFHKFVDYEVFLLKNHEVNESFIANNPETTFLDSGIYDTMDKENIEFIKNATYKEKMTHNDLLTVISELGLIGILFVVILFYKIYLELKRLLLHNRTNCYLSIALIGSSLTFSFFHNNMTSFMFWFVIFIPFIMNRNYQIMEAE